MRTYKIYSIKDNKKLSFILEGENRDILTKKLSLEGYIILSVEEVTPPKTSYFCFEGKDSNGFPVDGKIQSDDIFSAYKTLTEDYDYLLTRLHPEDVTDPAKQDQIFQELFLVLKKKDFTRIKKPKADTSSLQTIEKYRKIIKKYIDLLQKYPSPSHDAVVIQCRKLELSNSVITIQSGTLEIGKTLLEERSNTVFYKELYPVLLETGIHPLPDFVVQTQKILLNWINILRPLFVSTSQKEFIKKKNVVVEEDISSKVKKEYLTIHANSNVHKYLKKQYRTSLKALETHTTRTPFLYALFRQYPFLFYGRNLALDIQHIVRYALYTVVGLLILFVYLNFYPNVFIDTNFLIFFLLLLGVALVIHGERV